MMISRGKPLPKVISQSKEEIVGPQSTVVETVAVTELRNETDIPF